MFGSIEEPVPNEMKESVYKPKGKRTKYRHTKPEVIPAQMLYDVGKNICVTSNPLEIEEEFK